MTFLNAILLAGAAAFLIPLIIHLLNKRRVMNVQWGAMHLLHEALRQKKRNVRIEQLLLLLVRISIPILLALCLARPVMSWLAKLPGLGKTSLIVVLDNSFSMRAPAVAGTVRDKLRDELRRVLEALPRGSDATVILAGQPPHLLLDQPTTAMDVISEKLKTESSLAGPASLNDALMLAAAESKRMGNTAQEILLMSDFQQSDWRGVADGGTLPAIETLKQSQAKPLLTFYRVAGDLQENIALASVEPSAFVVARDQAIGLRARIQNHGQRAYQDIAVHLEADGARVRSTRVSIAPNAETVLSLTHSFATAGDHSLTVRVEGDAFPDDNAASLVIPVREQVNTLLIRGDSGAGPLAGAMDFLEIALAPHQSASATLKDVIKSRVVNMREFHGRGYGPKNDLDGTEVIVLANVQKFQAKYLGDLEEYVKSGGGLIIFAGPDCDLPYYQKDLYKNGQGLMPCTIKGFGHIDEGQVPARILSQRYTHPATSYFNDARGMKLQDAAFTHWMKFDKIEGDSRQLLSLDRGDPLMVEKPFGKGRVIAIAATANAQWSNLPLQPVFVPLMQRLVTYLATQNATPQYQMCGSTLRVALKKEQMKDVFTLTDPQNVPHDLHPQAEKEAAFVSYEGTQQPGLYELRSNIAPKSDPPRRFAFNLNAAESDFTLLPTPKTRDVATRFGAAFADSYEAYESLDRTRRHGTEIWQPLLLALLGFLFLEVFLQQRISRP
jgi:Aerotolerance regulator N-terminal/von Willebrand factor type A domain/CARDB